MWALKFSDFNRHQKTVKIQRALSIDKIVDIQTGKVISQQPLIKSLKNERSQRRNYERRELVVGESVFWAVDRLTKAIRADSSWTINRIKQNIQDYLFAAENGQLLLPDTYAKRWRRRMAAYGLSNYESSLYRFRHTFCTRLFRNYHYDPKIVQRLMGDNDMTMVMRVYNAISQEDILTASAKYAEDMDNLVTTHLQANIETQPQGSS